jgi:hypothetical protein
MRFTRFIIGVIGAVALGGLSLAQADPAQSDASSSAATSSASPSATQPAAPASSSATPAETATSAQASSAQAASKPAVVVQSTPEVDQLEKHFLAEGYKMEMHNGEKYFCRREEELGSHLGGHKACSTAQQLAATEKEANSAFIRGQLMQSNGPGSK